MIKTIANMSKSNVLMRQKNDYQEFMIENRSDNSPVRIRSNM